MPLGFLQQGPLTSRLRGGGEEPEKDAERDAEAVRKGTGEPGETMPEPEEPAGTKPGLQELSGTKNGFPGGRQTRSMTDALLWFDETEVGKLKTSVVMPKGFEELPPTDPQYQGIQGFSFGDFPPLGGESSMNTTLKVTKEKEKVTTDDVRNVERPIEEKEPDSNYTPVTRRKATEPTDAVEGVSHTTAHVLPAELPAAPAQHLSRSPFPRSALRFNACNMATGGPSIPIPMVRQIRVPGEEISVMADPPILEWTDAEKAMYQRDGV
jgi:hypothetical protein